MQRVTSAFEAIAANADLVEHHAFNSGRDKQPYFNYTFGTPRAGDLWRRIREDIFENSALGPHMRQSSMVMCSSESGWEDYVLLYHFDPAVTVGPADDL